MLEDTQDEADEEPVKVGWTRRQNGKGTLDEESGCT